MQNKSSRDRFFEPLARRCIVFLLSLGLAAAALAQPIAEISFPAANGSVDGIVTISGTANASGTAFDSYILEAEIGGGISVFVQFGIGFNPVNGGVLGTWNTGGFDEGLLNLRLTVFDENLTPATYLVPVNVDRTPPALADFAAAPNPSSLGTVQLRVSASEPLLAVPSVLVAGTNAAFVSQSGLTYHYAYPVTNSTPQGSVPVAVTLIDRAGHESVFNQSFTVDRVPPAAVGDLAAAPSSPGTAVLSWPAPADDGPLGRAVSYDVRYANAPLDAANFASAAAAPNPPLPALPGVPQSMTVDGLSANTTYFFAMKSRDSLGNDSALSNVAAWGYFADNTPPVTQIVYSGPQFEAQGNQYVGGRTFVGFTARDEDGGSGVHSTRYGVNGGGLQTYETDFTLSEGIQTLDYQSRDNAGNLEALKQSVLRVDDTPPVSALSAGEPRFVSPEGRMFVARRTPLSLSAVDPVSNGVAAGVESLRYSLDGGPAVPYASPFRLDGPDGPRTLDFYGTDNVQNTEVARRVPLALDDTPPETSFAVGGGIALSSVSYVGTPGLSVTLQAQDPDAGGVASGLGGIRYRLDGAADADYTGPLTFAPGAHDLAFFALDNLQNRSPDAAVRVTVDGSAPAIQVASPADGQVFRAGIDALTVRFSVMDDFDPQPQAEAFLTHATEGVTVPVADGQSVDLGPLAAGSWTITVSAEDWVGNNARFTSGTFMVLRDAFPPRSSLSVGAPNFGTDPLYASRATPFTLTAVDDGAAPGDGAGVGVSSIYYALDGGPRQPYAAPFTIPAGAHVLSYEAVDLLGNAEPARTLSVAVDATPPVSRLDLRGAQAVDGTKTFISSFTWLSVSAQDPVDNGVAAGLARIEYRVDTGDFLPYASPFRLAPGSHRVEHRAADRVGNIENTQFAEMVVDGLPPRTTLALTGPRYAAGGTVFVSEYTTIAFAALDLDESGNAGSGAVSIRYRVDGGGFTVYAGTFTLSEGPHTLEYFAVDRVGNEEPLQTAAVSVDMTPPVTTLAITGPHSGQPPVIGPATALSLSAVDPLGNGAASGVGRTLYRLADSAETPFRVYQPPKIDLTGVAGRRTLEFYSEDNLGRKESTKSQDFIVSAEGPPVSLISPSPDQRGAAFAFTPGVVPLLGAIRADGFQYTVSVATTADRATTASGGFKDVRKATFTLDADTLALWDARKLSGWHTVMVAADGPAGNRTVKTANLFLGDPALVLSLTKDEKLCSLFKQVRSLAVDGAGNFYVGMWNMGGVVRKFTPDGKPAAYLGGGLGMLDATGLAVDRDGTIYVADRVRHQVIKMDAGGSLIFRIGKKSGNQWLGSGGGRGEFFDPAGIALDTEGNLYVADRRNARVQKFNSSGLFLAQFDLDGFKPLPDAHDDHDSDEDGDRCERGKRAHPRVFPRSIALDGAGNILVTDDRHGRIYKLSPAGALLDVIGQHGRRPGDFRSPKGIAVTPLGEIYVADEGNSRVQRLDPVLNPVSVFGGRSRSASVRFNKPNSLAVGPDGKLFVGDYLDDEVHIFDAPGSQPAQTRHAYLGLALQDGADPAFRLGEVYSFPNPAKGGASPTIHAELGVADRVHVRIYDIAGALVHEAEIAGAPKIVNDGQGAQYAYEYLWDTSGVASGVYVCMIEAQKQGMERIRKTSKLAVVK